MSAFTRAYYSGRYDWITMYPKIHDSIENALGSRRREVTMESGLEQLERSIGQIIEWLERLLEYVNEVISREELPSDAVERRLMDIVNTAVD
ncbi:unnamed protein product [Cylicocyclus nassatus]|uniref:Uncharacterized protein n=1 Tax=Cylicocyclus nassatus TaxID=53992 RepID=A0AA36M5X7_CYLNA|nr:unnamed protein product [Cylicocyclus nassatus]